MTVRSHDELAAVAKRQGGVVGRGQLRDLGYSDGSIDRAIAVGRLHRVHRGVYAVGHTSLSPHGHCHAAILACGSKAVLSHTSAAWLWGLLPTLGKPVEIGLPSRGRGRREIRVHHIPALQAADREFSEGLPTTAVPRTLLDLASTLPRRSLEKALDRSERLGIFDLGAIDHLLARAGKHPGIANLRQALDPHREPAFTQSGLERRFLKLVREARLPMPAANVFVAGFQLDVYWEAERFAVELDGYEFHRGRTSFENDRRRQEELKLAGIEMVRFTARRVAEEPLDVMRRLSSLLKKRRRELGD
jgi:very-short-patch-repair endonuclease